MGVKAISNDLVLVFFVGVEIEQTKELFCTLPNVEEDLHALSFIVEARCDAVALEVADPLWPVLRSVAKIKTFRINPSSDHPTPVTMCG